MEGGLIMSNKEAELNNAILLYICECQVSGDFMALKALGIPNDIQEKLRTMTIQEVLHTSQMRSSFIKHIKIDSIILKNLLNRASEEKQTQFIVDKLIAHGAPLQLVKDLGGVTSLEFANIRKTQNIEFRGRTNQPTLEEEASIYDACKVLDIDILSPHSLTGEQWVSLSIKTNLPIRLIYKVICESEEIAREHIN
jgi:hypothetical protein